MNYIIWGIIWPGFRTIICVVQGKTKSVNWLPRTSVNSYFIVYPRPHHLKQNKNKNKKNGDSKGNFQYLSEISECGFWALHCSIFINNIIYSFLQELVKFRLTCSQFHHFVLKKQNITKLWKGGNIYHCKMVTQFA